MNGDLVIFICIGICIAILVWILFGKQIFNFIINGVAGFIIIYCINGLLPTYAIGINLLTMGVASLLGIPGIITLYIISMMI